MTRLAQKPVQRNKSADKPVSKQAPQPDDQKAARKPAFMQAKLAVSQPGDAQECEADQVAAEVSRSPRAEVQRASLEPAITPEKKDESLAPKQAIQPVAAATRIARMTAGDEESVQARLQRETSSEEETLQARLFRQESGEEEELQTSLARQADEVEEPVVTAGQTLDETTEARIAARQGLGDALQEAVRRDMEAQFGRDLSNVHIHTDAEAAELCAQVGARAFTVGGDIFFAPGEYAPETEAGRELLAHEMTHVVQQSNSASRKVMRLEHPPGGGASGGGTPSSIRIPQLPVPNLKANPTTTISPFYRAKTYNRAGDPFQDPLQQFKWLREVQASGGETKLGNSGLQSGRPYLIKSVGESNATRTGDKTRLADVLRIPFWNQAGAQKRYDVDHYVELQTAGWPENRAGNDIGNLRLLDSAVNQDSGSAISRSINARLVETVRGDTALRQTLADQHIDVAAILSASTPPALNTALAPIKRNFSIEFGELTSDGSGPAADAASIWSKKDIEDGTHIDALMEPRINHPDEKQRSRIKLYDLGPEENAGPATPFNSRVADGVDTTALLGSSERIVFYVGELTGTRKTIDWHDIESGDVDKIGGLIVGNLFKGQLELDSFSFDRDGVAPGAGAAIGHLKSYGSTRLNLGSAEEPIRWPITRVPGTQYSGYLNFRDLLEEVNRLNPSLSTLSPVSFDTIAEGGNGIEMRGSLTASLPIIRDAGLDIILQGNDIRVSKTLDTGAFTLPPPIEVSGSSLTLSFGARSGFSIEGRVDFGISNLGEGFLSAGASTGTGLSLAGEFNFDTDLFDRAQIEMWYRNEQFGAAGEIGIDSPDKIRGIRAANINARYEAGQFSATGTVQPSIPGVQEAGLNVAYSEAEGLTIGGTLQLAANPAIRSGSIDVSVNKRDDAWRVTASGTAQPAIPGIDSELTVQYDDGAFNAEFNGAFQRGMLAGTVDVGVTNRSVGEDGRPSGEPEPGAPLIVYGGGSATVQIAPWLQGRAGVRFAPNGEVTVSGEIGLPSQIEFFPRKQIDKDIFSIDIPIPIVPGIFAEVGGSLSAHAGIGPGVIDQLQLGIEYNPEHEENTHVTGDGHVNVPADAGLRLAVHGGIGLGIPAASVSGGLEVGGELGLAGAAEAGVHVDWMPSQGLQIDAYGRLSAHPKFLFDVSGYVEVEALFFTIYEERWQLASFEYGSDMTFGVNFPIRYREGEPFDISLDDVEFQTPEISATDILGGLVEQIV